MSESIKGKVAVISGVASGFAKATAELFAKEGCNLVMFDLNAAGLAATAAACEKSGSKVVSFVRRRDQAGDLRDRPSPRCSPGLRKGRLPHQLRGRGGQSVARRGDDNATAQKILDLNLMSVIMSCRTFAPQFKKQKFGQDINVSSVCDRRSWPGWTVYSAAKAGVNAFTKCLYTELRPIGVGVTLLVPGGSNTGFQGAAAGVPKFEWDESLAVRPEHFADMVYQTCALTKGGCVSEMVVIGLAQDISGF